MNLTKLNNLARLRSRPRKLDSGQLVAVPVLIAPVHAAHALTHPYEAFESRKRCDDVDDAIVVMHASSDAIDLFAIIGFEHMVAPREVQDTEVFDGLEQEHV